MAELSNCGFVTPNIPDYVSSSSDDLDDSRSVNRREKNVTKTYSPTSDYFTRGDIQGLMNDLKDVKIMLTESEAARKEDRERIKNMEKLIIDMKKEKESDQTIMQELKTKIENLCEENNDLKTAVQELQQKSSSDEEIIAELRKIAGEKEKLDQEFKSLKAALQENGISKSDWLKLAVCVIAGVAIGATLGPFVFAFLTKIGTTKAAATGTSLVAAAAV